MTSVELLKLIEGAKCERFAIGTHVSVIPKHYMATTAVNKPNIQSTEWYTRPLQTANGWWCIDELGRLKNSVWIIYPAQAMIDAESGLELCP